MLKQNKVFIGCSLDGYIADRKGGLEWLDIIPNPKKLDLGYFAFMDTVDALLMGRVTFETVIGFDVPWPYSKPVFVLSTTLKQIPDSHKDKAYLVEGSLNDVLEQVHQKGFHRLYIDGGKLIQSFLREDLIDEMIITTIPVLLGGGHSLFGEHNQQLEFELVKSEILLDHIVQRHYKRKVD